MNSHTQDPNMSKKSNPMDEEWHQIVKKLMSKYARLRLSAEDEETIKKIANKL
jgi:hypothetical protein